MAHPPEADEAALRRAVEAHGRDAVAFQGLEPGLRAWLDDDGHAVAYADTGRAWIAAGGPHAPPGERAAVAARFVDAARTAGRRASFFAVDDVEPWPGFARVLLGEQPTWAPARWADSLRGHRRLREQLRRARAKGLTIRRVPAETLAEGTALRARLETITATWLAARPMAPMGFLVTVAPFAHLEVHRYYVAERAGRACAFLSLVPVPARGGWLFEDLLRDHDAPNGTSESLVDAAMRDLGEEGATFATTGLVPLAGDVPRWMRVLGRLGGALYDFEGLRRFKERLHPPAWERVWLCHPEDELAAAHVVDGLQAFAGGSLIRFGVRTVIDHPGALAWLLGVPLVPWTALLGVTAATGHAGLFGFSTGALVAWTAFDALLAAGLLHASRRPRPRLLAALASAATVDAALSVVHLAQVGPGGGLAAVLRGLAALAPLVGMVGLWWASHRARRAQRGVSAGGGGGVQAVSTPVQRS